MTSRMTARIATSMFVLGAAFLAWRGAAPVQASLAPPSPAQANTCTPITMVPTVISTSGVYCLTSNLTHTSVHVEAISIATDAVVVDLGGFRLQWSGTTASGNPAIRVQAGSNNVVIRDGLISGFSLGVEILGNGTIVEDMRINNNDLGVAAREGSDGALIRRNNFRLGNGVLVEGTTDDGVGSVRIVDNDFYGSTSSSGSFGYNGIDIKGRNAMVVNNRFCRFVTGIWFEGLTKATGIYRDNISSNVATPYSGGTDAGNNQLGADPAPPVRD